MIEIAGDDEDKMQTGVKQTMQNPQAAPLQRKPSVGEQFGQMAMNRAMEGTLNAGESAITGALTKPTMAKTATEIATASPQLAQVGLGGAGEGALIGNALTGKAAGTTLGTLGTGTGAAAGAGGMAALGAAVPYVGAGLIAGKALGLFSDGGHVGPLYAAQGDQANNEGMLEAIARKLKSAKNYIVGENREGAKASEFLKGEGVNYKFMGGPMSPAQISGLRYAQNNMRMPNVNRPAPTPQVGGGFNPTPMSKEAMDKMKQVRQDFMAKRPTRTTGPSQDISRLRNPRRDMVNPGRGGK